jgi:hypothetical protein
MASSALSSDQADRVLPSWNPAGRGGGDVNQTAPPQAQIQLQAIAAGDNDAMRMGQAREPDHGIGDLLAVDGDMRLKHLALPDGGGHATRRGCTLAAGS